MNPITPKERTLVSIEKIYLEVRQKYSGARRIFNSVLGVWKCCQTRSFLFDILHHFSVGLFNLTLIVDPHQMDKGRRNSNYKNKNNNKTKTKMLCITELNGIH